MPGPNGRFQAPGQGQQQFNVDLKDATPRSCECGSALFQQAVLIYDVSAIMSPNGQALVAQQPVLVCLECRKPLAPPDEEKPGAASNI